MSRSSVSRSSDLLVQTREVLEALGAGHSRDEVDVLLERQLEAFSEFSRNCDVRVPLDPSTRKNIDAVLGLEAAIVGSIERSRDDVIRRSRAISIRRTQAQAFYSRPQEPPRFVTRRV